MRFDYRIFREKFSFIERALTELEAGGMGGNGQSKGYMGYVPRAMWARHPELCGKGCGQGTHSYSRSNPSWAQKGVSESRAERNGEGYSIEQVLGVRKASDKTGARGCASCTSKGTPGGGQSRWCGLSTGEACPVQLQAEISMTQFHLWGVDP